MRAPVKRKQVAKKPKPKKEVGFGDYISQKTAEVGEAAKRTYRNVKSAAGRAVDAVGEKIFSTVNPYGAFLAEKEREMKAAKKRAVSKKTSVAKPKPKKTVAKKNTTKYKF